MLKGRNYPLKSRLAHGTAMRRNHTNGISKIATIVVAGTNQGQSFRNDIAQTGIMLFRIHTWYVAAYVMPFEKANYTIPPATDHIKKERKYHQRRYIYLWHVHLTSNRVYVNHETAFP